MQKALRSVYRAMYSSLNRGRNGVKVERLYPSLICHTHHQGEQGIHYLGNKTWEKKFGTQEELYKWYIENDRD